MDNWLIEQEVDLKSGPEAPQIWPKVLMQCGDNGAHTWRVGVLYGGKAADLTGCTVTGYFIRGDGYTVAIAGSLEGSVATVVMGVQCYATEGELKGVLRLALNGTLITLSALLFRVRRDISDSLVDPGHLIPSLEDLLNQIGACEAATVAATAAATAANGVITDTLFAKTAANSAASRANTAATSAENSASDAILAAGDADDSADAANLAASLVNAAIASASVATEAANTAAGSVASAKEAASKATTAANTAATSASEAAMSAHAAAATANASTTAATTATTATQVATQEANTARDAANLAATSLNGMTVAATKIAAGANPTVVVSEVAGHKHIKYGLVTGDTGMQGRSYTIMGSAYATLAALTVAVQTPAVGDLYNVGSEAPYNVYRWTGAFWEDQGKTTGAKGEVGATGAAGADGMAGAKGVDGLTTCVNGVLQVDGNVVLTGANIAVSATDAKKLDVALAERVKFTQIYYNASVGSAFAAQTLALDLSKYSGVLVIMCAHILTVGYKPFAFLERGSDFLGVQLFVDGKQASRGMQCDATGIKFNDAYIRQANTTGVGTIENVHMVPFRIFGVEGVF